MLNQLLFIRIIILIGFLLGSYESTSQVLPIERSVDWSYAGLRDTSTIDFEEIDILSFGVYNDGITPNDSILNEVISEFSEDGVIINFPEGIFLFNKTIKIPSNVIIRGQSPENTVFKMSLGGTGHAINISGNSSSVDTTLITKSLIKSEDEIRVLNNTLFTEGDWIKIIQNDEDLVTSSWAKKTVGQIVRIKSIEGNIIKLYSPIRLSYPLDRIPYIQKIHPTSNIGIECIKIVRTDNTEPEQTSTIHFSYATNCWINNIESENCTFSHVVANHSSNIQVSNSYFHKGFSYGGGGRAYGVTLQLTSNECLVENNIFEHLRHSMLLQAGVNGNAFTYNYSTNPYWDFEPHNSAGDLVLHGNYVYSNLFEQNIGRNIVIDNSHGPNGPFNTFFRNRAEGFGIFFSADNSPSQNFIGNEITNDSFPYHLVNYLIQGEDHFLYGNNNKGMIHPEGTDTLEDLSYIYKIKPSFLEENEWAGIGINNTMGHNVIPSYLRYINPNLYPSSCSDISTNTQIVAQEEQDLIVYPNPFKNQITIQSNKNISHIWIQNWLGQTYLFTDKINGNQINTSSLENGLHVIHLMFEDGEKITKMLIKGTN